MKRCKTSMLSYCKIILQKVAFSRKLFLKEYRKSHNWLTREEARELKQWVRSNKNMVLHTVKSTAS